LSGTKQACLFRDGYAGLTNTGLSIYGLSSDSPTSNTTFKTKQSLPYSLLCDPSQTLIKAIGLAKPGKKIQRGVFVINKTGRVLAAEPGGPDATLQVVEKVVNQMGGDGEKVKEDMKTSTTREEADVAGEVADTAAKLDQ